jgi:2-hydroxymuconate-semialdehyde hydrolase
METTLVSTTTMQTAGLETHLYRAGEGNERRLLLLHGGGPGADAHSNWQYALPLLGERNFDVLAPDLAGFGATSHPDPRPDGPGPWMQLRVKQIIDMLDQLGMDQVDLVGNSLGGALTLHLLNDFPDRFGKAVLMGSAGTPTPPTPELIELVTFHQRGDAAAMRRLIELFVYDTGVLGGDLDALAENRLEAALSPDVRDSYLAMFPPRPDAMKQIVLTDAQLGQIRHPVLLVHGRDDLMIPLAASQYLLEHLPNADLHVFGRCGHWAQLERKGDFEHVVEDFLTAR